MIHRAIFGNAFAALILVALTAGCARDGVRAGAVSATAPTEVAAPEESDPIPWVRYFQALDPKPKSQDRTLILYFTADPCGTCQMLNSWTFSDKRVARALKGFVPIRIRGDVELQPARQFGVNAFPTIIFISPEDGEIDRKTGFRNADSMLEWIEEIKKNTATMAALRKRLEQDPADLEALLGQAQNYLDAGRNSEALELARKAEEIAPGDASVLALVGQCHLRSGELEKAETAIDAALEADERNDLARRMKIAILLSRADAVLIEDNAAEAIIPLSEVLRMEPENFDALIGAARALLKLDDPAGALEMLKQASKVRPNSPLPHEGLGNYHQKAGDETMAEREFLKAIEIEPRYKPPYFRLIELYEKQGKRSEMMKMYSRVLPLDPAGAHNEIAWLMATSEHADIRDPEAAIEHASIAIELEPHMWYIDTLAESYYAAGRYDTAIAVIKEAIARKPDDLKYYEDQLKKFQEGAAKAAPEEGK